MSAVVLVLVLIQKERTFLQLTVVRPSRLMNQRPKQKINHKKDLKLVRWSRQERENPQLPELDLLLKLLL